MENSFQEFVLDACLERAHAANSAEDASWRSTCTRRQQELGKRRGSAFCMSRAPGKEKSVLSFFFFALSGKKSAFSRFAGLSLALSLSIALSLRQALQRGFFLSRCLPPSLSLSLPPAAERSTRLSVKPETTALRTFSRSRRNSATREARKRRREHRKRNGRAVVMARGSVKEVGRNKRRRRKKKHSTSTSSSSSSCFLFLFLLFFSLRSAWTASSS